MPLILDLGVLIDLAAVVPYARQDSLMLIVEHLPEATNSEATQAVVLESGPNSSLKLAVDTHLIGIGANGTTLGTDFLVLVSSSDALDVQLRLYPLFTMQYRLRNSSISALITLPRALTSFQTLKSDSVS